MKSCAAHVKRACLVAMALSSVSVYQSAFAAPGETTAGDDIVNTATVNYQVSGVTQTAVNSNTTTFEVDKKVDLSVVSDGGVSTVPSATLVGLPFSVANEGNASDTVTLSVVDATTGDSFDVSSFAIYIDVNNNNAYDAGTDTLVAAPVAIPRDTVLNVVVVSTMPGGVVNGNTANMILTATTTSTATVGAESPTVIDVVFADTGNNGTEQATNTYTINTATLAVAKTATVLADPINCPGGVGTCGANFPKAIPGATIEYAITVTNSGGNAASSVVLTDNLSAATALLTCPAA